MSRTKRYPVICHVCGKEYEVEYLFAFFPASVIGKNGIERGLHACSHHTKEEVQNAYYKRNVPVAKR